MSLHVSVLGLLFGLLVAAFPAVAGELTIPKPAPADTCPVCGMLVAKYPEWAATVVYEDGHAHHFDGAKDLFKYLLAFPKFAPGHHKEDIQAIAVREYYDLKPIDAREAFYVTGSDVLGPMGHELIPLASRADAEEFMHDHQGRRVLTYDQVTEKTLRDLDAGTGE